MIDTEAEAEGTRSDLAYRLPDGSAGVFITHPDDEAAQEVLRDAGWGVIAIGPGADWTAVAARYPSVFGARQGGTR